jgi:hypothetical protein
MGRQEIWPDPVLPDAGPGDKSKHSDEILS